MWLMRTVLSRVAATTVVAVLAVAGTPAHVVTPLSGDTEIAVAED